MRYILVLILLFFFGNYISAQKFQKGNYDIRTGLGIGFFTIESNDPADNTDNHVNASSIILPVYAAFSVSDKVALGFFIQNDRLIVDRDSANIYGSMFHLGVSGLYRIINRKNDALNINLSTGYSSLNWTYRATNNGISGKGKFIKAGLSYYHFWTNTLGYYFALNYMSIDYSEIENKNYEIMTVNYGSENFYIDLSGMQLNAGVCLKF